VQFPTPPQQEILDAGLLDCGFNVILQMPTGSGKTWLAQRAIEKALRAGRKVIYLTSAVKLLPSGGRYKALCVGAQIKG